MTLGKAAALGQRQEPNSELLAGNIPGHSGGTVCFSPEG